MKEGKKNIGLTILLILGLVIQALEPMWWKERIDS